MEEMSGEEESIKGGQEEASRKIWRTEEAYVRDTEGEQNL